jgi:hypothetical protein
VTAGPTPWRGARGAGQCPDARDGNTPGWGYSPADRRSPPPCDPRVQANDLLIADIGADSGRARPSRHTGGDQPVVHRLGRHPPLLRHRRNRQPLVDIQPPQSRSHPVSQPTQPPPASLPSPSTIRPDAPGWRSRGGAASGHLAPLPHNPATPHPARPRRSLQPRAQIAGSGCAPGLVAAHSVCRRTNVLCADQRGFRRRGSGRAFWARDRPTVLRGSGRSGASPNGPSGIPRGGHPLYVLPGGSNVGSVRIR